LITTADTLIVAGIAAAMAQASSRTPLLPEAGTPRTISYEFETGDDVVLSDNQTQ
jgi:hypothetical protein